MRRFYLNIILFFFFSNISSTVFSTPKKIFISNENESVYLPYDFLDIREADWQVFTKPQYRPLQVVKPYITGEETEGVMIGAYNPALNIDNPANFGYFFYPSMRLKDDSPVRLVVNDWEIYQDFRLNTTAVSGAGYKNDSAWAFKFIPETDEIQKIFLTAGPGGIPPVTATGSLKYYWFSWKTMTMTVSRRPFSR